MNVVDVNIPDQWDWPGVFSVTNDVRCRPID